MPDPPAEGFSYHTLVSTACGLGATFQCNMRWCICLLFCLGKFSLKELLPLAYAYSATFATCLTAWYHTEKYLENYYVVFKIVVSLSSLKIFLKRYQEKSGTLLLLSALPVSSFFLLEYSKIRSSESQLSRHCHKCINFWMFLHTRYHVSPAEDK